MHIIGNLGYAHKHCTDRSVVGTLMGVGASLSPTLSGLIVHHFGYSTGFLSLALVGLLAFIVLALFLPATKEA